MKDIENSQCAEMPMEMYSPILTRLNETGRKIMEGFSKKRIGWLTVCGMVLGSFSFAGLGQLGAENVENEESIVMASQLNGNIDWSNGIVQATGMGFPSPDVGNAGLAEEGAKRAATVVARRNLLEIIQGIVVDSHTIVKNFMVEQDVINNKVQGIVKNSQVVKEERLPDGGYRVTLQMPLKGELSSLVVPSRQSIPQAPFEAKPAQSQDLVYTGLVIDAQGLPVKEALSPKVLMEDGRVVYGSEWVDPKIVKKENVVGYVRGVKAAQTNNRVISKPLVVKALRVAGDNKTDIVISDEDAQLLHVVPENMEFLEKAKVLVVLDR
jgi:hypothetical protein